MPPNPLTAYVDTWTVQAVMASRWLTNLYRGFGDDRQAAAATQAGAPSVERLNRLGLRDRVISAKDRFNAEFGEETLAEQAAWKALVEAQAGISAFYAMTDSADKKPPPGFRGSRTTHNKAFGKAIQGFRTAFPDEVAKEGVAAAIRRATTACVDAFLTTLDEVDVESHDLLRSGLEASLTEALEKAATGPLYP